MGVLEHPRHLASMSRNPPGSVRGELHSSPGILPAQKVPSTSHVPADMLKGDSTAGLGSQEWHRGHTKEAIMQETWVSENSPQNRTLVFQKQEKDEENAVTRKNIFLK